MKDLIYTFDGPLPMAMDIDRAALADALDACGGFTVYDPPALECIWSLSA